MLFDTDILIWIQRGNIIAASWVDVAEQRFISVQTYMELLQCARDKSQHRTVKAFLKDMDFVTLPLTEAIGHRAMIYVEEYALASGLRAGDAIVAATAVENSLPLVTANDKHFKKIRELTLKVFRP
ncbi:MAG: type II toxin-antitoxin system VapC family toxin [Deltaproteobacteria bacterium]|nr:type II toxin-antitoxin system VapC family toxin [Deltaproteobacteria bacterium]